MKFLLTNGINLSFNVTSSFFCVCVWLQSCCRSQGSAPMATLWGPPCSSRATSRRPKSEGAGRSWTPHMPTLNWRRATSYFLVQLAQVPYFHNCSAQLVMFHSTQQCCELQSFNVQMGRSVFSQGKRCWHRRWLAAWMSPLRYATAPLSLKPVTWEKTSSQLLPSCCRTPTTLWRKRSKVGRAGGKRGAMLFNTPLPTT